jgi:hypothetical protein
MATEQGQEGVIVRPKKGMPRRQVLSAIVGGALTGGAALALGTEGRKLLSGKKAESEAKIPGRGSTISEAPSPTPEPTANPEPTPIPRNEIIFKFTDNVPQHYREAFQQGAELSREYYFSKLGVYVSGNVIYEVFDDPSSRVFGETLVESRNIRFNTAKRSTKSNENVKSAAHEYFHLIQYRIGKITRTGGLPFWLYEGAAEFAGDKVVTDNGLADFNSVKNERLALAKLEKRSGMIEHPVSSAQSFASTNYNFGWLAIDFLTGERGVEPLGDFYKNMESRERNEDWKAVFAKTFGETIDSFSDRFEQYRRSNGF